MEKIKIWAENNGFVCYRIFDATNVKMSERNCTSNNDAVTELMKDIDLLSDGKYYVKGMHNPKDDRGAVRMNFQIGGNSLNNSNGFNGMDINQVRAEAYAQAMKDFQFELLDRRLKDVEEKQKIIIEVLKDLTDEKEDNDEKATDLISMLANAKDKFEGAKDILGDLKL